MASKPFNPATDIPLLAGKVILITGGTAGLGAGSIAELAKNDPLHIIFTGRNQNKANELIIKIKGTHPDVRLTFVKCDISSLASVKAAAEQITRETDRLDIFMLNAGIMAVGPAVSVDGYEIQLATNYLGHTLLVKLLLPILSHTAEKFGDVRVINMTSVAYENAPKEGIDFATVKTAQDGLGGLIPGGKWSRYGQSKLAQLLYSQELAKHHPELMSVSVHPGVILTGLFDDKGFFDKLAPLLLHRKDRRPVEEGHWHQCWAATCPKESLVNGEYYEPIGRIGVRKTKQSKDEKLADELWQWTEKELANWA